ncbi:hypothetical protein [Leeuwenhoekiella blandensis]|uniref:Uncharacterized protein n=1 Tax=Leeuwenhoekiella blandensis (strain CECT 7118 / CCUG 51940 / KCTC 22103 / MED217) TaxID=398720 RepID=A3XIT8_LEEBM|nr:hypothetical protein [Leeuwenhoekiella blandensis]EAQ50535.1 hypothetical protein MED217_05867 [Leeuwenhoekiella blandensis MED217]
MNFKSSFGKTLKNEIGDLSENILNDQWKSQIQSTEPKSSGILDCGEIISGFLKQDEFGCAFEHLTYVISETETNLTTEQSNRIKQLNCKLNS